MKGTLRTHGGGGAQGSDGDGGDLGARDLAADAVALGGLQEEGNAIVLTRQPCMHAPGLKVNNPSDQLLASWVRAPAQAEEAHDLVLAHLSRHCKDPISKSSLAAV